MSSQDKLNAFVIKRPWALALLSVVFVLLGVALYVNDDDDGVRWDLGSPFVDYVLAPITVLFGLAGMVAAILRASRR